MERQKMMTRLSAPLYSTKSLCAGCLTGIVLGIILGALLMLAGYQYHKRTSNPLLLGWSVASGDPAFDSSSDETPAELDFAENLVAVKTKSGEQFESPFELLPSDTDLGKRIVIHDYLGKEGCDISVSWSIQPTAHISFRSADGRTAFGIIDDASGNGDSIDYVFCG